MSADPALIPSNTNPLPHPNTSFPSPESEVTGAGDAAAPAESNTVSPSTPDLHEEFCNLCQLVTLATAINDPDNNSILLDHDHASDLNSDRLDRQSSILHAMASILVVDHTIIACMCETGEAPIQAIVVAQNNLCS